MTAATWYPLQVAGVVGVPASGVSSVQVSVTVLSPAGGGFVLFAANGAGGTAVSSLTYTAGGGSVSASSIVALAVDGMIKVQASSSVTMLVDVQGYYTAGNGDPAPGGYVPVAPTRIVDTRLGLGLPHAKLALNSTTAVTVGGLAGVPSDASAVFAMLTAVTSSAGGWLDAYPTGTSRPADVSLNYTANTATIMGAAVDLGAGGQFNLWVGTGGSAIDFVLDIVGYYTATPGTKGAFTPASARAFDSRMAPSTAIAANSSRRVQVGGVAGLPLPGSGISAFAISAQVIHTGTGSGFMALGPGDQRLAAVATVYFPTGSTVRNNLAIVPTAGDGTVLVVNSSPDPINVVLDVEGWYSAVGAAIPAGQSRTQENLTLQADPTGGGAWVTYQYRVGITGAWATVPVTDVTVPGTTTHPTGWPVQKSGSPAVFAPFTWDAGATLGHGDQLFQVQACFGATASDPSPVCSMASTVQLATHSFGDSYATDSVGSGSVSLLTGDYQVSANDVSVPTYRGSLSIGRSFTTLAPAGERADASGVFGPGWSASLPGADAGAAELSVSTAQLGRGYLSFTDSDGTVSEYQATSSTSSPTVANPITFAGVDDAAADGDTVWMPSLTEVDLTDTDGATTTWTSAAGVWGASKVAEAGTASTTTYTRDSAGRVTRILGAIPTGVSCASPDTTPGCRSLTLDYFTVAGHTRLQTVTFHSFDPATASFPSPAPVLAHYDYDSAGNLIDEYDPRITPFLKTAYTYDSTGRLATLTPPGLAPWTFSYDTNGRLSTVNRYDAALAQTATSTVVYSQDMQHSPVDLSGATTAAWGQLADLPVRYAAVFGPDHQPASTDPASVTSADWPYAVMRYLDANGRETNTASYGAGAWQYGATSYDANGNALTSLTPGNRLQALTPTSDTDPAVAALTDSAARAGLLASSTVYDPLHPDQVSDTYGPTHPVVLNSGSTIDGRSHQHTTYDQGAPLDGDGNPRSFGLPTTVTSAAWNLATQADADLVTATMSYSATSSTPSSALTGWDLRQATSTSVVAAGAGGTDLVTNSRFNDAGQTTQSWLPASSGSDAKSTSTTYYTAGASGACVSYALAGLACSTGPTAQPATGNPLPVTTTTYNLYDQPLVATETAGATVRTTTMSYDGAGRTTGTSITVTPTAAGGTALPTETISYDTSTGLPTTVVGGGNTLTTGYDSFGRGTSYTDATGNLSTTSYDIVGRAATVNDGKGSTTFTYDSATEHRGLVTAEDVGVGSALGAFAAAYNPDGNLSAQTYPNGLVASTRFDNTGDATALTYAKAGSTWLSFAQASNAQGDTVKQSSPASSQAFSYDSASRLIRTQDTVAGVCTTRAYTLDADSNRTALNSYPAGSGGACSSSTTPTTVNSSFDGAERITSTGYSYDTLGRTTAVPASDAQGIGSHTGTTGALTVGYYANDLVASETQGGRTLGFSLDPMQNRLVNTTDTASTTTTNHYADSSDSPVWTSTGSSWSRNIIGISGGLVATVDQAGSVILQLASLHGDLVATAADNTAVTAVTSYSESTEFGAPRTASSAPDSYGWLGSQQRSANDLGGLSLMGVRLYNPVTARFLSVDPVVGGNDNAYVYPLDPLDMNDTSGTRAAPDGGDRDACTCTAYNRRWRPTETTWKTTGAWKTMASNSTWWGRAAVLAEQLFTGIINVQAVRVQFRNSYRVYRACVAGR
ncbi:MAG: RHS repeat-associated core domain-containing protein [Jatrophihabitans sp.]